MDCKPPEYCGSTNPTVTYNWLREIDRALDACQCEPELRVLYASRLFKDRAMEWWDSITAHIPKEQISQINWEQFYNKVCKQYCTSFELGRIRKEFMDLEMTDQMTVDDVIEQFNDKLGVMRHNAETCSFRNNVCWNCQKEGHRSAQCPSARRSYSATGSGVRAVSAGGSYASTSGQKRKNPPVPEGRAFQMSVDVATATDDMITGMFLINSIPARVLFNSGTNRSFMSVTFCDKLKLPVELISTPLRVEVADGKTVPVTTSASGAIIDIDGGFFPMTCLVMPITSFDVVLGMDWLSHNRASIKCHKKIISFPLTDGTCVVARGECERSENGVYIPVVSEYPEVFPDELPGLPPVREVEYKIDLVSGATPVAKVPYRLAP
ncbi:uncharacterized protein [Rutidosis leptorrhynchoides]|uniref:uncharacterized protein n=1 Tax=Rutidosis leptorrhynchoides TaxID=125765 RepID=UPI003A997B04